MSPSLAKLLMCVCAGGTGAAIVPAAKAIHNKISPRQAVVQKAVAQVVPCEPIFTAGPPLGVPDLGFSAPGEALPAIGTEAAVSSPAGYGGNRPGLAFGGGGGGGGGFISGGGGGGSGGSGGGTPGGGGTPPPTGSSNAPEPAAWAMMITGFGLLGGTMRYVRNRNTAVA